MYQYVYLVHRYVQISDSLVFSFFFFLSRVCFSIKRRATSVHFNSNEHSPLKFFTHIRRVVATRRERNETEEKSKLRAKQKKRKH